MIAYDTPWITQYGNRRPSEDAEGTQATYAAILWEAGARVDITIALLSFVIAAVSYRDPGKGYLRLQISRYLYLGSVAR